MPLSVGDRLGHYEIVAPIGAGGMGEVYRARDTKLKRDVALKVLPDSFASDPERMARLQREAEVLASLNHPNIAQIYGVEDRALVMELVEGETLKGPLPVETALNYAKQISEALEAAHEKGIVHRDLKPANIKITPAGVVKVLDFGLAKAAELQVEGRASDSPTFTMSPTRAGMILGTAAYMSPEQARGKPADKRADIWAFGVVLYEMISGVQLFKGETITDLLAAVVKEQPDLTRVPYKVRRLLQSCLQKDPKQRLQAIADWQLLLEGASPPHSARKGDVPWIFAAILMAALVALSVAYFRRSAEQPRLLKVSVLPPDKLKFTTRSHPTVSPDGRHLAFVANANGQDALWVRDLDSLAARQLPGTEGAHRPFWSPDSRFLAFFAGGKLKKIDIAGGPPSPLCDAEDSDPIGGSWSKNDVIVFGPSGGGILWRVAAAGGSATVIRNQDGKEGSLRWPWFLPDGRHFLYTAKENAQKATIYAEDVDSKTRSQILPIDSNVTYAPPGYLLFMRDGTLMAQPFNPDKRELGANPVPLAAQVDYDSALGIAEFSNSQNGVLAYTSGVSDPNSQLTWFDRSGKVTGTVGAPGLVEQAWVSPNGDAVVVNRRDSRGGYDLWLYDLSRGTQSRLTFSPNPRFPRLNIVSPIWSPDGSRIAFGKPVGTDVNLFQKTISGSSQEEALDSATDRYKRPTDWSGDGRFIIEETLFKTTGREAVWVLPLFGDRKPFPYLHADFNQNHARLSPNGHYLAYVSDETNRKEIYVQTFPSLGSRSPVSVNGGDLPIWSRDGKELFFIGSDRKMMEVQVKSDVTREGARFDGSVPKPLFETRFGPGTDVWFDVSKDGRFLIPTQVEQQSTNVTMVVNWTVGLRK
jgi:serine/threonine protein kinase